jgi:hypothetical protein
MCIHPIPGAVWQVSSRALIDYSIFLEKQLTDILLFYSARVGIYCAETATLCANQPVLHVESLWRAYETVLWKGQFSMSASIESLPWVSPT